MSTPGIELYVTSLDPVAKKSGWEYLLRRTGDVVETERLAVAVNACLFASDSGLPRMPGDFARSAETVVSDHVVGRFGGQMQRLSMRGRRWVSIQIEGFALGSG